MMEDRMEVRASPAKKQKQLLQSEMDEEQQKRRSYAAVVRASLYASSNSGNSCDGDSSLNSKKPTESSRTAIVVEAGCRARSLRGHGKRHHQQQQSFDVQPYLRQLDECLELEVKYRGSVQPSSAQVSPVSPSSMIEAATITSGMRDGSAHVLRCLKVWYDLPSDIFFNAISSIDRFLSKMKAQPKHLSCIAVASFHLACLQFRQMQDEHAKMPEQTTPNLSTGIPPISVPDASDLVTISQSRCSSSDLLRMQTILANKLEMNPGAGPDMPVTALSFLRLMFAVSRAASVQLGLADALPAALPDQLLHQLEILGCDSLTLGYRPAEVALALLATDFQQRATAHPGHSSALMGFISELQKYCNISSGSFVNCLGVVMGQLDKYNGECTVAHRQRLVWKLSNRTLRHLRPTDKLRATLPTIKESSNLQRIRAASEGSNESLESLALSSEGFCESDREMDIEEEEE